MYSAVVTLIVLILFSIISFKYSRKDVLSPWFLVCVCTTLSYSLVFLNWYNWNVKIYWVFTGYLAFGLFSWLFGSAVCRLILRGLGYYRPYRDESSMKINPRVTTNYPYLMMMIISVVFGIVYLALNIGGGIGSLLAFQTRLRENYDAIETGNFLCSQVFEIEMAIAYISVFRLFSNKYYKTTDRHTKSLYISILFYLMCTLISADRNILLRFFIYFIVMYILFFREGIKKNINWKILRKVIPIVIVVIIVFYFFGKMKMYNSNLKRAVGIYAGSGLYNFNMWIKDFHGPYTEGLSKMGTFLGSFSRVTGIKFAFPTHVNIDNFIIFRSNTHNYVYSSNIYSDMKFAVQDFGLWGLFFFTAIEAFVIELFYLISKRKKYSFGWILFAITIYPAIYFPISGQFWERLHLGRVYEIAWMIIIYFLIYGKHGLWRYKIVIGKSSR